MVIIPQVDLFGEKIPISFRIDRLLLPGCEDAQKMTTTSGYKCLGSGKTNGSVGLLEESCLKFPVWKSDMVLLTWKHKVTKQGNIIFQLGVVKPTILGDDLLWRTPSAQDPGVRIDRLVTKDGEPAQLGQRAYDKTTGRLAQCGLTQQVQMWSTPRESDGSGGAASRRITGADHRHQLREEVLMWPTPSSLPRGPNSGRITRGTSTISIKSGTMWGMNLETAVYQVEKSGNLNPDWVEWLMGFPKGWTDLVGDF